MRKIKILFIDDENARRKLIAKRWPDAEILTCETSQNAIKLLDEAFDEPFDYIYLDHDLGEIEREPSENMYEASPTFSITIRPFVRYVCRHAQNLQFRRLRNTRFIVHSWNAEAAEWIYKMLQDYNYDVKIERFVYE